MTWGHGGRARPQMPEPLIIAHRGASGDRPEHTLAAYECAARAGADFLEPDLVVTADGHLVARHENEISATTDIAQRAEFAARRTTKLIDGRPVAGWFTEDLTLAELRTLRCRERLPELRPGNTAYDGQFPVPTLAEILQLRAELATELGRDIGLYPELKHPSYFQQIGLPLLEPLCTALAAAGLTEPGAPLFVQCFEISTLIALRERHPAVPLIFLMEAPEGYPGTGADPLTPQDLRMLTRWVDGIGPDKQLVIPPTADGALGQPSALVEQAHAAGLVVHPWSFRRENAFLPTDLQRPGAGPAGVGDLVSEIRAHRAAGVDAVFTDHTDLAVAARGPAAADASSGHGRRAGRPGA